MRPADRRGFAALVSVMVIAAVIMSVIVAGGASAWYTREEALEAERRLRSESAAEACIEAAALALARGHVPPSSVTVDPDVTCAIEDTSETEDAFVVRTRAEYPTGGSRRSVTALEATIDPGDFTILSIRAVAACDPRPPPAPPCAP
jgi:type II secretory pathway pseudopilin PulG